MLVFSRDYIKKNRLTNRFIRDALTLIDHHLSVIVVSAQVPFACELPSSDSHSMIIGKNSIVSIFSLNFNYMSTFWPVRTNISFP